MTSETQGIAKTQQLVEEELRIILTFETLHRALAAEKLLRQFDDGSLVRTTPTPPFLTSDVCGMALEVLKHEELQSIVQTLSDTRFGHVGVHKIDGGK